MSMEAVAEVTAQAVAKPIRRLSESVVNRIAAGEVIQRPSSALKELLENSLDAGATVISVVIKDGGLKLIQITDNGHGIRHEDMPILCERHTTSKLHEFEDLQTIRTLGFRGEALASISFVAHLSVTTMTEGQIHGYRAAYKDGRMQEESRPCAAVKGTQITVEDLFYNVVARKKAFKNPSDEYSRVLDVVSRYAVHNINVNFSCKKYGEKRADVNTVGNGSQIDAIRAVYGPAVARQLLPVTFEKYESSQKIFGVEGLVSSANYTAKKTVMVLFINDRLVECAPLKRAIEVVYAAILPKASKPFVYISVTLPSEDVDVNIHPTKREVSFLHQEVLIDSIQKVVEEQLMDSNTSRTFVTQTLLPGACLIPAAEEEQRPSPVEATMMSKWTSQKTANQKTPVNKLVRTDALNPAGRLHAFMQKKPSETVSDKNLVAIRKAVRQRRNPKESAELTSVQELLACIDQQTHGGLLDIVKHGMYVGMADETLVLAQYKTRLYLLNVVALSKEMMYQQVLRRFGHFNPLRLSNPAPLVDLLMLALDEEEHAGRWHESDGPKDQIAQLNAELLLCKAEMLQEYFALEIDENNNLCSLPIVLDHYSPDMDRLPQFILALGNNVDWESEKECFESFAAAVADFYAMYPPLLPHPSEDEEKFSNMVESLRIQNNNSNNGDDQLESDAFEEEVAELVQEAEKAWAQRNWTIQHVLFPAMKLFLKPPSHMADDGTAIQIACLENLYKIFERC